MVELTDLVDSLVFENATVAKTKRLIKKNKIGTLMITGILKNGLKLYPPTYRIRNLYQSPSKNLFIT